MFKKYDKTRCTLGLLAAIKIALFIFLVTVVAMEDKDSIRRKHFYVLVVNTNASIIASFMFSWWMLGGLVRMLQVICSSWLLAIILMFEDQPTPTFWAMFSVDVAIIILLFIAVLFSDCLYIMDDEDGDYQPHRNEINVVP